MNTVLLKCPNCDADLEIDKNRDFCFCQYCGCKILIDNSPQEVIVTKNININRTNRYINDADIIRARNESDAQKSSQKVSGLVVIISLIGIIAAILVPSFLSYKETSTAVATGMIHAGNSEELIGENYETVEAHLRAAGFTNIELVDLDDSGVLFWTADEVELISIGGKTSFTSSDWFNPDTEVVISYH